MSNVIFTRGIPGSGKSTWARETIAADPSYVRVNQDSIREMFGTSFSKENERMVVQLQDEAILAALRAGRNVIVDNTHLHKGNAGSGPQHIMTLIWESGIPATYEIADFAPTFETCFSRNLDRAVNPKPTDSASVPEDVMYKMLKTREREMGRGLWTVEDIQKNLPEVEPYVGSWHLPPAYIFDIDGTLADTEHRSPYDFDRLGEDGVHEHVAEAARALHALGNHIVLMSGRDSKYRQATEWWLFKNGVVQHTGFFMRKEGDTRRDSVVKLELFNEHVRGRFNVKGAFDDRLRVCRIWHQLTIPVMRVGPPDADF